MTKNDLLWPFILLLIIFAFVALVCAILLLLAAFSLAVIMYQPPLYNEDVLPVFIQSVKEYFQIENRCIRKSP